MINNSFYDQLDWDDPAHPVALLRAENKVRNPWICEEIARAFPKPVKVLDIGCGGGLLTRDLSERGHAVSGVDLSEASLVSARRKDERGTYVRANAEELPFVSRFFQVVCAMDLLEHVERPAAVIEEASRVLAPGGLFFFHTFHRTPLSWLMVVKGVEWCVANTPKNMHLYSMFIKPKEMESHLQKAQLSPICWRGLRPKMGGAFLKMLCTRKVPEDFSFLFCKSLATGYCGVARKLV